MEIQKFIEIFRRRKWVAILTVLVTIAVVGLGSYLQQPTYSAVAMVRVAQASSGSIEYIAYMYAERLMNTYIKILKSRPILEEIIQRLDLPILPGDLADQINVEALPDTELLSITVSDSNPARAQGIANTLAVLLVEQSQSLYFGGAKSAREILQEQLDLAEDNLGQDRAALQVLFNNPTRDQEGIAALNTKIKLEEETYANLLRQYEEARVAEASRANSVTIIEPAVQPDTPSRPRRTLNIALGTLVGLVGGIGLAFLFENLDPAIHSADDLEAVARVPVWGYIPSFAISRKSRHGKIPLDGDGRAPAGEAFRILRTNILSPGSGTPPKTILITSAEPGAGKSTVLVNLAAAMAQAGRKVVVVDSDLRHPCLHQVFDLPNEMGLSSIIHDSIGPDKALQATKIQGVSVLTGGPLAPNPAKLLDLSKMKALVQKLAEEADIVLFDTPPILAVADTAILAPLVDGVLLVAARDQATRKHIQSTLQQLDRVGARVLGLIFNKAKAGDGDYYQYYHSNHYSGRDIAGDVKSIVRSLKGLL